MKWSAPSCFAQCACCALTCCSASRTSSEVFCSASGVWGQQHSVQNEHGHRSIPHAVARTVVGCTDVWNTVRNTIHQERGRGIAKHSDAQGVRLTPLAHIHFSHQHSALPGAYLGMQSFTISQGLPAAQPALHAAPATSWVAPIQPMIPDLCIRPGLDPFPGRRQERLRRLALQLSKH